MVCFEHAKRTLFYSEHTQNQAGEYLLKLNNLLGKVIPFTWREFPILPGPLLEVLPLHPLRSLHPCTCFTHTEHLFLYTKTTLTSPILLVGPITLPSI
jgi:hypothetical protein